MSTHLYHDQRLSRDHLLEIAAHGFESVEVFATRTHFDYHNPAAIADLQQWLAEAGLELHGHSRAGRRQLRGRTLGAGAVARERRRRERARARWREAERALHIARRIPAGVLVAHLGLPRTQQPSPADNNRDAARRSIEELQRIAEPLGVRVAVEVIPNELSRAGSLVHFVEDDLDGVGICLDFGHAHLDGDVVDAIETVSEHLIATHVHDNRGRSDDHLVPFEGTIDWPAALTAVQKVGYDGTLLLRDRRARRSTRETLAAPSGARDSARRDDGRADAFVSS